MAFSSSFSLENKILKVMRYKGSAMMAPPGLRFFGVFYTRFDGKEGSC